MSVRAVRSWLNIILSGIACIICMCGLFVFPEYSTEISGVGMGVLLLSCVISPGPTWSRLVFGSLSVCMIGVNVCLWAALNKPDLIHFVSQTLRIWTAFLD